MKSTNLSALTISFYLVTVEIFKSTKKKKKNQF